MGNRKEDAAGARAQDAEAARDGAVTRDRRCTHHIRGAAADPYQGQTYLRALQRLKGSEATRAAREVEPFFWSDAKVVRVWLCRSCAAGLGLDRPM